MDNEIMVSILCATYNHKNYIAEALDSFIMQKTNFKFEVIINDDASTDGTADIIREYEQKYPDIIKPIYQTENQYSKGVKITRDINLPRAKGKYVAFCEGDDYWVDENKLQMQVDFLEKNPEYTMCVHSNYATRDNEKSALAIWRFDNEDSDMTFEEALNTHIFPHTATMVMKNEELLKMYNEFPLSPYMGDYTMRLYFAYSGKVRYIDKIMSVYRRFVSNSWTETGKKNREFNEKMCRFMIYTYFDEIDKYSEYKYHKEIQQIKYKYAFNCYLKRADYKKLYKSDNFNYADKSAQVRIRLGIISPWVIHKILKIRRKALHKKHVKEDTNKNLTNETFFKKTKKED